MSRASSPLTGAAPGLSALVEPYLAAGALDSVDVHVVDHLGRLAGEADPEVLLACACAVRAPRHGHVCVDLAGLAAEDLLPESEPTREGAAAGSSPLALPCDRADWAERVAASALVSSPAEAEFTPFVLDGRWLYTRRYWTYQRRLAGALSARSGRLLAVHDPALLEVGLARLFPSPAGEGAEVLDRQRLAAAMAVLRGFAVISGGPGTGKTYTVRNVITLLLGQWLSRHAWAATPPLRIALAAPTGKAATRLAESLRSGLANYAETAAEALGPMPGAEPYLFEFLAALEPRTLHRLLQYDARNPTRFRRGEDNTLPYDVVVVDEASMVDLALMSKLVAAMPRDAGSRLILLGDKNQLASVGAGTVLADICGPSRVESLTLSTPFAAQVLAATGLDLEGQATLVSSSGPQDCIVLLDRSRRFEEKSGVGALARVCPRQDFDPEQALEILRPEAGHDDVQRLDHGPQGGLPDEARALIVEGYSPYVTRLFAGRQSDETLEQHHAAVLRLLDRFRILCAHRQGRLGVSGLNEQAQALLREAVPGFDPRGAFYLGRPILVRRNNYAVKRFNGDVGVVVDDARGRRAVAFPGEGGAIDYLAPVRLPEHDTVFSMTIHKSQGSEFQHALIVLPERPSPILTRELVYTGITRAKERMTLLGSEEILRGALRKQIRRASGLRDELWGDE